MAHELQEGKSDELNNVRRWKKYRFSRRKYPTRVIKNGDKGVLVIGRKSAEEALKKMLGRDVSHMRSMDTKFEWVFAEPISKSARLLERESLREIGG